MRQVDPTRLRTLFESFKSFRAFSSLQNASEALTLAVPADGDNTTTESTEHDGQRSLEGFRYFLTRLDALPRDVNEDVSGSPAATSAEDIALAGVLRRVVWAVHLDQAKQVATKVDFHKREIIRKYCKLSAPDVLEIMGKERNENAHSDILRWLLDPMDAPGIAGPALSKLLKCFQERFVWEKSVSDTLSRGLLQVSREVPLEAGSSSSPEALGRIDILITGPKFVIAIENKVGSAEGENQTKRYEAWLDQQRRPLKAGIFLTPLGNPAHSSSFLCLSYLDLHGCILEGPSQGQLRPDEELVLAGYVKTLVRAVLRSELEATITM